MSKPLPEGFGPRRILVIQLRQIGDALLTTPALRALRKRFPHARISFLADKVPARVLTDNPNLDEIIIRDPQAGGLEPVRTIREVRRRRFDLVIDYLANPRTTVISLLAGAPVTVSWAGQRRSFVYTHPMEAQGVFAAAQKVSLLRLFDAAPENLDLDLIVPERARTMIGQWADQAGITAGLTHGFTRPLICWEPLAKHPVLTWPERHHVRLARMMAEQWNAQLVLAWGPGREQEAHRLAEAGRAVLAPPTDLQELAALHGRCDIWVGNDGGTRHIAASQGLPTFAVFGPTDDAWTPPGDRHLSVTKDGLACRPCNQRVCPEGHHHCMEQLEPDEVFTRIQSFWDRVRPSPSAREHLR